MRNHHLWAAIMLSLAATQTSNAAGQPTRNPLPEASESTIEYETVAEALEALRSKAGVVFTMENGWLIVTDEPAYAIWSFAPQGYPAFPAVVKRSVTPRGSGSTIQMAVHCEASKEACDDLVRTFSEMNGLPVPQ
jgi:hypothetical protein